MYKKKHLVSLTKQDRIWEGFDPMSVGKHHYAAISVEKTAVAVVLPAFNNRELSALFLAVSCRYNFYNEKSWCTNNVSNFNHISIHFNSSTSLQQKCIMIIIIKLMFSSFHTK